MTTTISVRSTGASTVIPSGVPGSLAGAFGGTQQVPGAIDEIVIESDEFLSAKESRKFLGVATAAATAAFLHTFMEEDEPAPSPIIDEIHLWNAATGEQLHFDEGTMSKVWKAMRLAGIKSSQATDAVTYMQNEGILFRERVQNETKESE